MWVVTRTDARDLINLAHAARVFSGTRGVGEDTEWVLEAAMAGVAAIAMKKMLDR